MKPTKHILLLAALLLCSFAASADNIASGICGNNLTWELTDAGELIVGGTGAMGNYTHSYGSYAPWNEYRNSIKTVTILEGVTTIGERAFWSCIYLTSITISESVTSIGYGAFMGCSRLPSIDIPDGVTSIGSYAFEDCTGLTTIIIPNGVTSTGGGTFQGCSSLTSVTISEKMTVIGEYTFYGCSSLTSIKIPDAVARIEMYAFNDCSSLAIVTIGKGVTSVNGSSFQKGCNKIHTVINYSSLAISKGSTDCGYVAYYAHKVLDMDELENLGGFLFYTKNDIHYLAGYIGEEKQIVFPESYKESNYQIASYAFEDFSSLSSITIPESVTSIGGYAFYGCSSLTSITCKAVTPPTIGNSNTFYNVDKSIPVYVPAASVEAYKSAEYWSTFTNIQPLPSEYILTVSSAGYASLFLDYAAAIPEGVKVYIGSKVEDDRLMMTEVTGVLPANTGVIVRAPKGTYSFVESEDTPANVEGNLLSGTATDTRITAATGYVYYVLANKDSVVGMYRPKVTEGTFLNNANKAYLALKLEGLGIFDEEVNTDEEGVQLSIGLRFDFSGTTDIAPSTLNSHPSTLIYDLQGRRVENPTKGIYIINGKKVVWK